jgi:hypothetical protein
MGTVWLKDPSTGELLWYDWCTHADSVRRYGNYDVGRFLWVSD